MTRRGATARISIFLPDVDPDHLWLESAELESCILSQPDNGIAAKDEQPTCSDDTFGAHERPGPGWPVYPADDGRAPAEEGEYGGRAQGARRSA